MHSTKIAFIGGGNMARGLIGGLLRRGYSAQQISVAEPLEQARKLLSQEFAVNVTSENAEAARSADVVVLAVKPQQMAGVAGALSEYLVSKPLVISVAAGIRAADLSRWLGVGIPVVRCMPNRPALTGSGASGLYASTEVSPKLKQLAEDIISATGICEWVDDEALLDAVTALSGSGPAYFFLLAEHMAAAGVALGLAPDTARRLAAQTLAGAGQLVAAEPQPDLARMRAEVTSKGGTTEAALYSFAEHQLPTTVQAAMNAAAQRSRELAEQFGR